MLAIAAGSVKCSLRRSLPIGRPYVRRYEAMRFIANSRADLQLTGRDNFHLNDLGYRCMAEHIAHAVIVSLFDKKSTPAQE